MGALTDGMSAAEPPALRGLLARLQVCWRSCVKIGVWRNGMEMVSDHAQQPSNEERRATAATHFSFLNGQ